MTQLIVVMNVLFVAVLMIGRKLLSGLRKCVCWLRAPGQSPYSFVP
jgi:hypothetical protein